MDEVIALWLRVTKLRFGHVYTDVIGTIEMAGKVSMHPLHHLHDVRIELHPHNAPRLMVLRQQDIHATAGPQD